MIKFLAFIRKLIYWVQKKCGYGKITQQTVYFCIGKDKKYHTEKAHSVGDIFKQDIPPLCETHGRTVKVIAIESIPCSPPFHIGQKLTIREI
jgi:hypothetical protein